jgi:hypothetical protein
VTRPFTSSRSAGAVCATAAAAVTQRQTTPTNSGTRSAVLASIVTFSCVEERDSIPGPKSLQRVEMDRHSRDGADVVGLAMTFQTGKPTSASTRQGGAVRAGELTGPGTP